MAPRPPKTALVVIVTAPFAKARPARTVLVSVMSVPARTVPWKAEVVRVTAWRTHQVAPHGLLPTIVKLVAVRAPVPPVAISNNHGPLPFSVSFPVNVAAAAKQ